MNVSKTVLDWVAGDRGEAAESASDLGFLCFMPHPESVIHQVFAPPKLTGRSVPCGEARDPGSPNPQPRFKSHGLLGEAVGLAHLP
jgi:hypothetical protein